MSLVAIFLIRAMIIRTKYKNYLHSVQVVVKILCLN